MFPTTKNPTPGREAFSGAAPVPLRRPTLGVIAVILVLLTATVYWPVRNFDFINFDDDVYVSENRVLAEGFSRPGLEWALTADLFSDSENADFWAPVTFLSHLVVAGFFGLNPAAHHLANVLLHLLNTLVLFRILTLMTGRIGPSALVAALFAVHPVHVESVAWVTERKDVLSGLFFLLTLRAYLRYVENPGAARYALVMLAFVLGLLSKPMVVTLPFVLLLLDFWPLGRLRLSRIGSDGLKRAAEKIPLFLLSALSGIITWIAVEREGALVPADSLSLGERTANALVSYVAYLGKMIWPVRLAVFYPHPGDSLSAAPVAGAALVLVLISATVIWLSTSHGYLLTGWLWYLGTLVPVIGLVQAGRQAMADRYTYLPLIGVFIMIAWGIPALLEPWRHRRIFLSVSAGVWLIALVGCTRIQVGYWKNSITLFERALEVTDDNYLAHLNLGVAERDNGRLDVGLEHLQHALRIKPAYAKIHYNLAETYQTLGRLEEARDEYQTALSLNPVESMENVSARNNLGAVYQNLGRFEEAVQQYEAALRLSPGEAQIHNNLGIAYRKTGRLEESIESFRRSIALESGNPQSHNNLANALADKGDAEGAVLQYREAIARDPGFTDAHYNLAVTYRDLGRIEDSIGAFESVIRLDPEDLAARTHLADLYDRQGQYRPAIEQYQAVLARTPGDVRALMGIARSLSKTGEAEGARKYLERALEIRPDLEAARQALRELPQ